MLKHTLAFLALILAVPGCGNSRSTVDSASGATLGTGDAATSAASPGLGEDPDGATLPGLSPPTGEAGGSSKDAPTTPSYGTGAEFADLYIQGTCQLFVKCGVLASVSTCRSMYLDDVSGPFDLAALIQGIDSGRILFDKNKAVACMNLVSQIPCAIDLPTPPAGDICTKYATGTAPSGTACVRNEECAGERCRRPGCTSDCCLGICASPAATGAACQDYGDCGDTDFCRRSNYTSPGICSPKVAAGQPCQDDSYCQDGLACDTMGSKTCLPKVEDGAACKTFGLECAHINSYCDEKSGKCQPRRAVGAACSSESEGRWRNQGGCVAHAICLGGTCVERPLKGEACAVADAGAAFLPCQVGTCTNGTCQVEHRTPCTVATAPQPDGGVRP